MSKKEPVMGRANFIAPSNQELVSRLHADLRALESRVKKIEGMLAVSIVPKNAEW